ncbi:MAG TPA: M48 family metallopeptidase [Gemmatimonadales bacterium]|nr:M48 family metallopeptidase [Gemmatimonadales bacterium]
MSLAAVLTLIQQVPDSGVVAVPVPSALAVRYHETGTVLWVLDTLIGLAIPAVILFTGWSAGLRNAARRVGRGWAGTVVVYAIVYLVLTSLVVAPLSYYEGFVREHAYGLTHQTFAKWLRDWITALGVGCVIGAIVGLVAYGILRRARRWWLWTGLAALPLLIIGFVVAPVWIAPLFNRFGPLENKTLERRILAEADRAGITGSRVYEVNKSVDTEKLNAYVAGIGGTKRIVLYDTILRKFTPDEILFVLGHEMGHYVLGHVTALLLTAWAAIVLTLWLIFRWSGSLIARWDRRFGFTTLADPASVPLLLLLGGVISLGIAPFELFVSRHVEHEADRFGLELTRDNHAAASSFVKLDKENLGVPYDGLIDLLWRDGHPSDAERIEFANTYRPWETGQPLKYGDRFRAR